MFVAAAVAAGCVVDYDVFFFYFFCFSHLIADIFVVCAFFQKIHQWIQWTYFINKHRCMNIMYVQRHRMAKISPAGQIMSLFFPFFFLLIHIFRKKSHNNNNNSTASQHIYYIV